MHEWTRNLDRRPDTIAGRVEEVQSASGVGNRETAPKRINCQGGEAIGQSHPPSRRQVAGQTCDLPTIVADREGGAILGRTAGDDWGIQLNLALQLTAAIQEGQPRMPVPSEDVTRLAGQSHSGGGGPKAMGPGDHN